MSFDSIPSKSEVMGWDPPHLADYLRRNMSDNDLQKFPKLHAPLISKISKEINKKEEKRGFFQLRSSAPKYQEADLPVQDQGWDSEEFESDDDYESPNTNDEAEGSGGDYESAADGGGDSDNGYEPPPSEPSDELQHHQICVAKHSNSEYIDRSSVTSQPPVPPARPGPGSGPPLPVGRPSKLYSASKCTNTMMNAGMDKFLEPPRMPKPPVPTSGGVRRSASSVTPGQTYNRFQDKLHLSSLQTHQEPITKTTTTWTWRSTGQDMDPAWYVGQVTRGQAEGNLRHVNRDGTFLVRDSSKGSATQPYTLMVLYQNKVFNIQIRKVQNGFLLGTGLKSSEVFQSVSEIVNQHMQMPLLLIDAKSRGTGQQNQCALLHPAGF
ncbi:Lymphocyte cytosolic protein 2 [Bagarius yarrelli]|uniref:Lymphocyte cytosolic protein 2 n=1 Tax=Bagarius yarrelli TaxID=175774 RepID=A0A556TXC4_BAGYA|nr:Lymphocyte cytosolic protein 2 [Bagarius yarrelli]